MARGTNAIWPARSSLIWSRGVEIANQYTVLVITVTRYNCYRVKVEIKIAAVGCRIDLVGGRLPHETPLCTHTVLAEEIANNCDHNCMGLEGRQRKAR